MLLITEPFLRIRDRVAQMLAMPGYPVVVLRHPISILTGDQLATEADRIADAVVQSLTAGA